MPTTRPVRNVRHPGLTDDRRQVMLAVAREPDAAEHDHFVITFGFFEGLLQDQCGILAVASKIFLEGTREASGSFDQTVPLRIITRPANDGPERIFDVGSGGPAGLHTFSKLSASQLPAYARSNSWIVSWFAASGGRYPPPALSSRKNSRCQNFYGELFGQRVRKRIGDDVHVLGHVSPGLRLARIVPWPAIAGSGRCGGRRAPGEVPSTVILWQVRDWRC